MLANVAIDGAAGQDVMMNQTGQGRPPVSRAAREQKRAEITRQILDTPAGTWPPTVLPGSACGHRP
jgi:hypothetical protein